MKGFLRGSATAMITPFDENGVNLSAFGEMMEYQIAAGTSALIVLGTTGEPATMEEEEKTELIRYAVRRAAGRIRIVVGTGSNNTRRAVEGSKRAQDLGADGILVVTPYYNKCTQAGLIDYYEEICRSVSLPVICYNVPGRTGVNLLPETMAKIAEIENIAGIKEASGNMAQVMETARAVRGKCDLYSGEDALNLPILAAGGSAVISVVSNIAPELVKELCDAMLKGDFVRANEINDLLLPLGKACFCEVNPIPAKAAMFHLGFDAGIPRSPLTPLENRHHEQLCDAMRACGLEVVR